MAAEAARCPLETALLVPARAAELMRPLPLQPAQEGKVPRPVQLAEAPPLALQAQQVLEVAQPLAEAPLALVLPAPARRRDGPAIPAPPTTLPNSASLARCGSRNLGG